MTGLVIFLVSLGYTALVILELSLLGSWGLIPALFPWLVASVMMADS